MSSLDDLASAAVADAVALYSARSGPAVRAIMQRRYAEDATFDDGAVSVKGHPDIIVQFVALKVFPQVSVVHHIPSGGQQQNQQLNQQQNQQLNQQQQPKLFEVKTTSLPGRALVEFGNKQSFSLPFSLTTVTLSVDTQLELDASTGKITKHVDKWRSVGVGGGALAVPAPTMPRFLRAALGRSTSLAMRLAGVGGGNGSGSGGGEAPRGVTGRVGAMLRGKKAD